MKRAFKKGISFGTTSGIITTLGLMVGLNAETGSRLVVAGGIITIAIADAMSDSLGMHMSEEASKRSKKEVWQATLTTFFFKFFVALTFLAPLIFFKLSTAIFVSVGWGLLMLCYLSFRVARSTKDNYFRVIVEHLIIAIAVITVTHYVGHLVGYYFGQASLY